MPGTGGWLIDMSFIDRCLPAAPAFHAAAREVLASRPDLRAAYPDGNGIEYRKWLLTYGVLEYPDRLGAFFPPVPPEELRRTACGGVASEVHLRSGLEDAVVLHELARTFVTDSDTQVQAVLDMGCSCGRIARWLPAVFPAAAVHGADVRTASIDWCRQHLPGSYVANGLVPPLPYAAGTFDVILALSVFTHLSRPTNAQWIAELVRVCKPGGRIIVSMLGSFALFVIQRYPENQGFFMMTPDGARDYMRRLPREHWIEHAMPRSWVESLDGVEPTYGQVFSDEMFVRTAWAEHVDVIGTLPAGQGLFQDYYVLQPRR